MNTFDPSLHKNQAMPSRPDWFEVFLPMSALPLLFLLFLVLPLFLLAAESLFAPVVEFIQSLLIPVNAGMTYTGIPLLLIVKILLFSAFTFTGITLLLLKVSCIYHEVWSHFLHQPHPRHVPYHPDQQESMVALFNWNIFRWYKILGPVAAWTALTIVVGAVDLWLFNSFTDFGFFGFQLQLTLGFFMMSVLGFFTFLAACKAIWAMFTTILGDVAAMTEPEKPTQVLYERSRRLSFGSPWVVVLYPVYFLFYLALVGGIIGLIVAFDIQDILTFNPDILIIYGVELATLVVFLTLSAMKFMAYHDALGRFYQQLR